MKNMLRLASLAGLLALANCTVSQMAVAPEFQQTAAELPVSGRKVLKPNGNFQIGGYTVANVHRGWRNLGGFSIFSYNNVRAKQQYEFSLQDGEGSEWYVFGASKLNEKSLMSNTGVTIDVAPNMEYYACHFTSPESGQWHLLTMDPGQYLERKKFKGELSNRSTTYTIAPVYRFAGGGLPMSDVVGYEFKNGDAVVATVQVINNGKVWVSPKLAPDARMVLVSGMASLLLYEKLNETVAGFEFN
ncbi:hypothetical protein MKJ04_14765 [Pontibacter sp. E15-1]|uniref:hypothetical protein n=1 Tax=Pontibacter sp. E15-1 TaxID=2919918 RepID=UPI001F4FE263|nr:hypothetical protein [Pontibacter sp. E15-1]MCJ8166107.1 hypothetical protein [Pontibacter sp. E15-1]